MPKPSSRANSPKTGLSKLQQAFEVAVKAASPQLAVSQALKGTEKYPNVFALGKAAVDMAGTPF